MKYLLAAVLCLVVSVHLFSQTNTLPVDLTPTAVTQFQLVGPTRVFHARIDGESGMPAPAGYLELLYDSPGGRSELNVAIKPPVRAGRVYAENDAVTRVGVAFSNPNSQDVNVSFFFTDFSGTDFGSGNVTIPANGQLTRFLAEAPFNAPALFQGSF